jgi:GMP synthase (glutamine-hydrolysing)
MPTPHRFLIIDAYSKTSRDGLEAAGMVVAHKLYARMLHTYLPDADCDLLLPSDPGQTPPDAERLAAYSGILWTGCDLSINDTDNPSVRLQIDLAKQAYAMGIPSFGSCWGLQIAVVAAGGAVEPNPKGREMGIARKIGLTEAARSHPMFAGRPPIFEAFISHDDTVTRLPEGAVHLAGNDWTRVQAAAITHDQGTFWAVQYHPEYDLRGMACLIQAREAILVKLGFYRDHDDLVAHVNRMTALCDAPQRKDLRWQLAVDDDILDPRVRQGEFINWLNTFVTPVGSKP